jgi:hypothetical protein
MKICTLSPQGNGIRCGGITRFSGALYRAGVDNFFWEISNSSWNGEDFDWEGTPFRLDNEEDEKSLSSLLESYDIVINNWPTLTTNEHRAFRLWNVWKNLKNPLKVTVIHNTILSAVRKENLSPLVWSASDYLLVQVAENSSLCVELVERMPWLASKIRQFRQSLEITEFENLIEKSLEEPKDATALWVGRWEGCRNTARWSKVLGDAKSLEFTSKFSHVAMGLESDVKTYWGFFNSDKGNHVRLNSHRVTKDSDFIEDGHFLTEKINEMKPFSANDFAIFGPYEYSAGMSCLSRAAWGISIFGPWKEDVVNDYRSLAKLEFVSLEIMLLSLPVFDKRHLSLMTESTLQDAEWVLKSSHTATPEENVDLLRKMEEIFADKSKYRDYRLQNIEYVRKNHTTESFLRDLNTLYLAGKTACLSEKEVLNHLYGTEISLDENMWVSLFHTRKGQVHEISWEKEKMNVVPRTLKQPTALF